MYMCSFLVCKNACLNYREFDLEGDLVGVPYTWYLSGQSFITPLKHHNKKNTIKFEENRTLWLWMIGKRTVSVCSGHELPNALYISIRHLPSWHQFAICILRCCVRPVVGKMKTQRFQNLVIHSTFVRRESAIANTRSSAITIEVGATTSGYP